jgi:hypothetical protein
MLTKSSKNSFVVALITKLSFDEFVIINCLLNVVNLEIVALTKQGFYNAYEDIVKNNTLPETHTIRLTNRFIKLIYGELVTVTIYYSGNKNFVQDFKLFCQSDFKDSNIKKFDLVKFLNKPRLDYKKSCYDGQKLWCTPEALKSVKTKKLTGIEKITTDNVKEISTLLSLSYNVSTDFWKVNSVFLGWYYKTDVAKRTEQFVSDPQVNFVTRKFFFNVIVQHIAGSASDCVPKSESIRCKHFYRTLVSSKEIIENVFTEENCSNQSRVYNYVSICLLKCTKKNEHDLTDFIENIIFKC